MNSEALTAKFAPSPWPAADGQVLFLIDAGNSLEQRLLTSWIQRHQQDDHLPNYLPLSLRDDRKPLAVDNLIRLLKRLDDQTMVVPLRICWTRSAQAVAAGPRVIELLGGGDRRPGGLKARAILRRNPERMHPRVGTPATVADMAARFEHKYDLEASEHPHEFAVFVARQAAIVLDIAERKLLGGRYKVPRYVAQSLRNNRQFKERLFSIAEEQGRSHTSVMREVNDYFREMISIPTSFWLDVWAKFCNFCLGLGYEPELNYRKKDLDRIRTVVRNHPSALLWTHKTYIDGFVVPKLLFDNNFPVPHFFGGANLNIPVLGFLVRRAGGVFIKRSFSDNEVYKATLRQYISYLMEKRFPLTWSFEGTRSRLGKLMPPKYGILKYVLEGCYSADARDIHIIPVTVSYDLVRDAEEYAREQAGTPKAPESLSWLIGYVRSLARPMGKIYVDFGEPVVLPRAPDPEDKLALSKVAFQVAVEANRVTPITVPAVISMVLGGVHPRAVTAQEAMVELNEIIAWAKSRGLRLSPDLERQYPQDMSDILELMIEEDIVTRFEGGPATVYAIKEGRAAVASYYRNTIVHYFINKAIIELCLIAAADQKRDGLSALDSFWKEVDDLRDLFKFEFFYPPSEEFREEIRQELNQVCPDWEDEIVRGSQGIRRLLMMMTPHVAHMTLQMFIEAYSLGADIVAALPEGASVDEAEYVDRCMNYGRQALLQWRLSSEASISKLLFKNSWSMLSARGLVDQSRPDYMEARAAQAAELNALVRRVEISRASAIAARGTATVRDSVRAQL